MSSASLHPATRVQLQRVVPEQFVLARARHVPIEHHAHGFREVTFAVRIIRSIHQHVFTGGTQLLCEPLAKKPRSQVSIDGKYSIPFTTGVMMARGNVTLRDYTDEGLRDPAALAMADKVSYRAVPGAIMERGGSSGSIGNVAVEIKTKDGRLLTSQPTSVPGGPGQRVGWDAIAAKFRDCVSFAVKPIPAKNIDRAIELVRDLENQRDMKEVMRLFC